MDASKFILRQNWHFMQNEFIKLGLNYIEGIVIQTIDELGNINQEQISKESDINKFNISRTLTNLENEGYVSRNVNPNNRREYIVQLTQAGKEKAIEIMAIRKEWLAITYQGLSQDEIDFLNQILEKIVQNICKHT